MTNRPLPLPAVLKRLQTEGGAGNFLVIEEPATGYYIQIAGSNGSALLHLEAVGNAYLDVTRRLSPAQHNRLRQLGWSDPAQQRHPGAAGSLPTSCGSDPAWSCPNHFIDCQVHDGNDREWLARLIMKTFADVYGIGSNASLDLRLNLEECQV
ncbi:MAG TPA: hypothetical protein VIV61_08330 [Candidatus Ozemobacteraceae bacterium]